jgi:cell division protein FtsB
MVSDTQTTAARSAALGVPRVGRTVHTQSRLRFATGIVLVIALATAAFGVGGYMQASRSQRHVAALQADLASLQQRVGADERAAAGDQRQTRTVVDKASAVQKSIQNFTWQLQSVPTEAQLAGLRNQLAGLGSDVAAYAACIPRLQAEINGLRLSWRIDATKPSTDSFRLFTAAPASASCSGGVTRR